MPRPSRRASDNILTRAQYRHRLREHDLQAAVLEYLDYNHHRDVFWFAIPNAGKRSWQVVRQLKEEGMKSGVADICLMLPGGRVAWLEMKTVMGRQSEAQQAFEEICKMLGHPYCLARTLDAAVAALRQWGALKETK